MGIRNVLILTTQRITIHIVEYSFNILVCIYLCTHVHMAVCRTMCVYELSQNQDHIVLQLNENKCRPMITELCQYVYNETWVSFFPSSIC
jgi:type III secretory pathway component EscR